MFLAPAKLRVRFINVVKIERLLKIAPYRHPKFGSIRKKPYLCTVVRKKGANQKTAKKIN